MNVIKKGDWWVIEASPGVTSRSGWKTKAEAEKALKDMIASQDKED